MIGHTLIQVNNVLIVQVFEACIAHTGPRLYVAYRYPGNQLSSRTQVVIKGFGPTEKEGVSRNSEEHQDKGPSISGAA